MATTSGPRKRSRGQIESLCSGSLRVRVYAGIDPILRKRRFLEEVIPRGPKQAQRAEQARTRMLNQVDEQRAPRTSATVGQLLDKYLELVNVDEGTRPSYEGLIRLHIRPLLGHLPYARVDGEVLDSFYKELRRCRRHCREHRFTEHRTDEPHECDGRCKPHECRGLAPGTIRKVQAILTGAGKRAKRWGWAGTNRFELAEPVPVPKSEPRPPTAEQAATIVNEAWQDVPWGLFVWLAMVTGARRGELCALTWDRLDFTNGVLVVRSSIAQQGGKTWEKDTKSHQHRRVTLDAQTVELLRAYRCQRAREVDLGDEMPGSTRIFSPDADGESWLKPDTVTRRFARMCQRLGWDMHIHQLRHYSATELIAAGVDVRTVAGRLGHGGGGTTTLRIYTAWLVEGDQRAAGTLTGRMPALPAGLNEAGELAPTEPERDAPYQRIAADLRGAIVSGVLEPGERLPTVAALAHRYAVSDGTAQRAVSQLRVDGLVTVGRGKRAVVVDPATYQAGAADVVQFDEARRRAT